MLENKITRTCKVCGIEKELKTNFRINNHYKGKTYYDGKCKICRRKQVSEWAKRTNHYKSEKFLSRMRLLRGKSGGKIKRYQNDYHKRSRKELRDSYIKRLIRSSNKHINFYEITEEMMDIKRTQIALYRLLKNARRKINESTNY